MGGITYNTLSQSELKALPVQGIAAKDCALFLWATMPKLPEAIDVINAWGFKYTTCAFTWVKQNPNGSGIYCYDDQTEVLTNNGFKLFRDLKEDDKLATLNQKTNLVEYHLPFMYVNEPYNGEMIYVNGKRINLLVTPDHDMFVKSSHGAKSFSKQPAKHCSFKNNVYKKNISFEYGEDVKHFSLPGFSYKTGRGLSREVIKPDIKFDMDKWIQLLAWFITEGDTSNYSKYVYRTQLTQSKKANPENFYEIKHLLEEMGISFFTRENRKFIITEKRFFNYFSKFGKSHEKYLPGYIFDLSKRQIKILFDTMIKGDGSISGGITYYTTSKKLSEQMFLIGLMLGYTPTIHKKQPKKQHHKLQYEIYFAKSSESIVGKNRVSKVKYDGPVYCVNIQNGVIYVRRNGKSCWSGNSGLGHWTNGNAELCLFAKRGSPKRNKKNVKQIVLAPRGRHSAKPLEVKDRIVELMGDVPRIELFAREKTNGWEVWGEEVNNDIELEI